MHSKFNFVTEGKDRDLFLFVFYSAFLICATAIKVRYEFTNISDFYSTTKDLLCLWPICNLGHTFLLCFIIRIQNLVKLKESRNNNIHNYTV